MDAQRKIHSDLLVLDASQVEHHPLEGANVSIQILNIRFSPCCRNGVIPVAPKSVVPIIQRVLHDKKIT
jgi:hypothetical protein